MMTGADIRRRFLDFFQARGHKIVPSSSLVPVGDPTLLFTNAGMNQFKDVFLGLEQRDYTRATTVQKCVRAGGKHNDLENVGFTHRHHTFFEMLGNFSFGNYFKDEAIAFAWELLTSKQEQGGFGMDPARLYATVFEDDDQAEAIWKDKIGIPAERVFRLGAADNFWAMGDTGPCGPCSELHYDQGAQASEHGHTDCTFPCECGRYVEIWNLVFMQFERDASGTMTPLPKPSIDTGMGLERVTAVLQGQTSNYATDLFQPIIAAAGQRAGRKYGDNERDDVSLRILADHARSATFLVHDGVVPGNEGRGYVLRKIIRRALRHGRLLGIEGTFLKDLAGVVADNMSVAYPELEQSRARVATIVGAEEERFSQTLTLGLKELEKAPLATSRESRAGAHGVPGPAEREAGRAAEPRGVPRQEIGATSVAAMETATRRADANAGHKFQPQLPGAEAFRLYDTFGLPIDLLREIADERGFTIDETGFEAAMEAQRERARKSWKGGEQTSAAGVFLELAAEGKTKFEGYETTTSHHCRVRALLRDGQKIDEAGVGVELDAVLDHTPFYAASGGQVGDRGVWTTASGEVAEVLDCTAPVGGLSVHRIRTRLPLHTGDVVDAEVDVTRRNATRRNHTATHLLQAALRQVLGTHVKQAGSVVEPGRLRFDFTHFAPVTPEQIEEIERLVNTEILANAAVNTEILPLEKALESGAMALFGEKYQENVRVVTVPGFSKELCGGTHCRATGDIGLFKIVHEGGVAAGVRRIEAVTGEGAYDQFRLASEQLHRLGVLLHAGDADIAATAERLLQQQRELQDELRRLKMKSAQAQTGAAEQKRDVHGVPVVVTRVDGLERPQLRTLMDELRRRHPQGVVALGSADNAGKAALIVAVSPDLSKRLPAGKIVKAIPDVAGGGRPELAEAGAKDPERLDAILASVFVAVEGLSGVTV